MSAELLLSRLENVRQTGAGRWMAKCPAHEDRTASLSIRELPDGRVLINDFGGCAAADVVSAIGVEFAELFPPADKIDHGRPYRQVRPAFDPLAALHAVAGEMLTVAVIAESIQAYGRIDATDYERLGTAVGRIHRLLAFVAPDPAAGARQSG